MKPLCLTAIAFIGLLAFSACDKDDRPSDCDLLKTGISKTDPAKVKDAISGFIHRLPSLSQKHSAENLQKLADAIKRQCGANVQLLCYACIQTLPEMSEIKVSYLGAYAIIDISIDREGTMVYSSMHE
jgi:hypothetical protein